ncbi:hypothetical protein pb186bvf_003274 [Paramecium bursaria]
MSEFQYLNNLSLDQIAKKLQFLNEIQKQQFKEFQKDLWKGKLNLDDEDHNQWKKTELSCILILPYYIIIRLLIKQQLNKPQPQNDVIAKIRRVLMVNKGFVPAMILTIFPINSLVTYHFKTSYKHFIIKNSEKYDDLL